MTSPSHSKHEKTADRRASRGYPDLREHLANLDRHGLLLRIDRPIDKDTELHPLVRCQFIGGIPENERRAFLFTDVVDFDGRHYDIPVVVGAFAASPRIYAIGMGCPIEEIGAGWLAAIGHPIPPVIVSSPRCQEVVIAGDDLRRPGGGLASLPVPISTPGFDAAPYLTATLAITPIPIPASERRHLSRGLEEDRPAGRAHGVADRRRRRLSSLDQIPATGGEQMPLAFVIGAPRPSSIRAAEARHRRRRDSRWPARLAGGPFAPPVPSRSISTSRPMRRS